MGCVCVCAAATCGGMCCVVGNWQGCAATRLPLLSPCCGAVRTPSQGCFSSTPRPFAPSIHTHMHASCVWHHSAAFCRVTPVGHRSHLSRHLCTSVRAPPSCGPHSSTTGSHSFPPGILPGARSLEWPFRESPFFWATVNRACAVCSSCLCSLPVLCTSSPSFLLACWPTAAPAAAIQGPLGCFVPSHQHVRVFHRAVCVCLYSRNVGPGAVCALVTHPLLVIRPLA